VGEPARRGHADPQPLPRVGLRPHPYRPRDDGGRQRGRAARSTASSRRRARAPVAARCGSCRSRRSSRRPAGPTSCAGPPSTGRPGRHSS
jgi:hypothetical protein